jgi:hypothetical protein
MTTWRQIDTAPKDGSTIQVKRIYQGKTIYEGPAAWRQVRFKALFDPLSGEKFADDELATGWMYPDIDKRVPEPTHWQAPNGQA